MEKHMRIDALKRMLEKFGLLSETGKNKGNDYADGVKDTLASVRLFTKL